MHTVSRVLVLMLVTVVAGVTLGVPPAAADSGLEGRIVDRTGRRIGEIRRDAWGGYSLFDERSRRLGWGRDSSDGRVIEFFAPDGRRLFEIRRDPPGRGPQRKVE